MPKLSRAVIEEIKQMVVGKDIYLVIDETSDIQGRFIVAVLVGILGGEEPQKPKLFDLVKVQATNHKDFCEMRAMKAIIYRNDKITTLTGTCVNAMEFLVRSRVLHF